MRQVAMAGSSGTGLSVPEGLFGMETVLTIDESVVDAVPVGRDGDGDGDALVLALADLLFDERGEVVMAIGPESPLRLLADRPVVAEGVAGAHVTASGIDVTGLAFRRFRDGTVIYFPVGAQVRVESGETDQTLSAAP